VALDGVAAGGTSIYSYSWDFGDGTASGALTLPTVVHTYTLPGTYTATLSATSGGATATDFVSITALQPVPTVGGLAPNAGPETGGTAVTITGTYFMNLVGVKFGSTAVAAADLGIPACNPDGSCTVTVNSPARPEGNVHVTVTTNGGISLSGNDQFTYLLAWSLVQASSLTATTQPSPREGAAMVNDGNGVLLFGGFSGTTLLSDTWHWSNGTWTQISTLGPFTPPARAYPSAAYNSLTGRVVLFGGACGLPAATTTCDLNDTWNWDPAGQSWSLVQAGGTPGTTRPSQRTGSMLAKDSSNRLLLFGGDAGGIDQNDTWTFTGTGWTPRTVVLAPSARTFSAMATDASGQVLLFGGSTGTGVLSDTWTWNGNLGAWSPVVTLAAPAARQSPVIAFFNKPNSGTVSGLALFGGRDGSGTALGDTWTWNGTTWVPLYAAGPGQPPARGGAMGTTDSNGSIVMFGGGTPTQLNDLWRLS
jgi:PKD repeat protein